MNYNDSGFLRRQHHMPHWQQGGSTYFITFRSQHGAMPEIALSQVMVHIRHDDGRRYELHLAVVMPDHVHLLLRPLPYADGCWYDLSEIMRGIKGSSARRINQLLGSRGSVWQSESFDRIVRNEKEYRDIWNYMLMNPVKKGLCLEPEEYDYFVWPQTPA